MTGQVMPGEAILKNAQATTAELPLESIEALVAEHSLMAFRIAYSILRNYHDAEDAVQECFMRMLKYRTRLHEIRNAKTWVARIAWTAALDRRSSRARVSANEDLAEPQVLVELRDRSPAADVQLAGKQLQGLLEQMIMALPEELRRPLELSTVQELNSTEIAEIMNIPEGTVRTRLMRARQRLKEKLSTVLETHHG
ncbi:MAG TPA: RNA polymerase sigma factor [Candidatus Angelobacter sp.]|nr:RNA polymerase sigma factor [Candidatus Angelobacter sp.]